jgi:hypothetical protein
MYYVLYEVISSRRSNYRDYSLLVSNAAYSYIRRKYPSAAKRGVVYWIDTILKLKIQLSNNTLQ